MTEQRTARDPEQHLYLLFDDWHSGYSIRKVSLSRRSAKRSEQPLASGSGEGAEPLPGVFMRVQALRGYSEYFTSAFGTKIAAMHPGPTGTGVPMIDVRDQIFISGPMANYNIIPIYFPIGDNRLFVLDFATFDCFLWMPEHSEQPWVWKGLPYPPFERLDVSSYGVQPDGCILISTKSGATLVFDTDEHAWKPYGNFALPFTGRGYYDTSLEGFVGLSKEDREGGPSKDPETLGYLYCCTGADFKRTREKVYSKNPAERHVSATLLHMWPGKFCLVECVSIDNGRAERFMYRLKTFCLVYDAERGLKLKHCHVRCYSLPHEATTDFILLLCWYQGAIDLVSKSQNVFRVPHTTQEAPPSKHTKLPEDFVKKQRAYFADIDTFELPEEECTTAWAHFNWKAGSVWFSLNGDSGQGLFVFGSFIRI